MPSRVPRPPRDPVPGLAGWRPGSRSTGSSAAPSSPTCCARRSTRSFADDLVYGACFHDWAQLALPGDRDRMGRRSLMEYAAGRTARRRCAIAEYYMQPDARPASPCRQPSRRHRGRHFGARRNAPTNTWPVARRRNPVQWQHNRSETSGLQNPSGSAEDISPDEHLGGSEAGGNLAAAITLVAASCGGDDDDSADTDATATAGTDDRPPRRPTQRPPRRPAHTERTRRRR